MITLTMEFTFFGACRLYLTWSGPQIFKCVSEMLHLVIPLNSRLAKWSAVFWGTHHHSIYTPQNKLRTIK